MLVSVSRHLIELVKSRITQSQQDFAKASWAQKQVLAGTMSARELRSLNRAVTSASSSGASPRASRQSFRPRRIAENS